MTGIQPIEEMETGTTNGSVTFHDHMHGADDPTPDQAVSQKPRGEGVIFTDLPDACMWLIVSFLSPEDVARGACVSLGFRNTLDSDSVWDQFVPKSALKVVDSHDELKSATKKKIFSFLRNPFLLRETLAFWLDQRTGRECYSVAAKGLRVVWGENHRYWEWSPEPGARWPEVAHLHEVWWFHISGSITCELPPGTYTLSWRIRFQNQSSVYGWDGAPTEFRVSTKDESQEATSHRYLTNLNPTQQTELGDLTPFRLVDDSWFEFDAGEITVCDEEKVTSLEFSMVETNCNYCKSGISLDGVVLRPSSLTRITGRYLSQEELEQNSLLNELQEPPVGLQGFRGRLGVRGHIRGVPPRRRHGARPTRPNPRP